MDSKNSAYKKQNKITYFRFSPKNQELHFFSSINSKQQPDEKEHEGYLGMTASAEVEKNTIERVKVATASGNGGGTERLA